VDTQTEVLTAIAGFVDWFGRRWVSVQPMQRDSGPSGDGSPSSEGASTAEDPTLSTCAAACPPSVRGKLYVNPGILPMHLQFRNSPRVPKGMNEWCVGLEEVHSHYSWNSSWTDPVNGKSILSSNWHTTVTSAAHLRAGLQGAVAAGNNALANQYCQAVLKWGGVSGAVGFLKHSAHTSSLISYLTGLQPLLNVKAPSTAALTTMTVRRFDSGMTKVHSILDGGWTPIYDSRVGAAIAMFFQLYYADTTTKPINGPDFPSGGARGTQIRDPGEFVGLAHAPQLHTPAISPCAWAQNQLKLAWVIEALLNRHPALFSAMGPITARAHAFEGTLFMLGYDLRCFIPAMKCLGLMTEVRSATPRAGVVGGSAPKRLTWVPIGISMPRVAALFLQYATTRHFADLRPSDFISWQTEEHSPVLTEAYARANATVLRPSEFDLCDRTETEIRSICRGGTTGLQSAMAGRSAPVDERERVCLVAALLYGTLRQRGLSAQAIQGSLIDKRITLSVGSAKVLIGVGRSVGRFFGLLNEAGEPTEYFRTFFSDEDYQDLLMELLT
jgi:hypothetical protein